MKLTQEIKDDIDMLATVIIGASAVAKALQRKYGRMVPVTMVRDYMERSAPPKKPRDVKRVLQPQQSIEEKEALWARYSDGLVRRNAEQASNELLARVCRAAFKHGYLLPSLTIGDQLDRARADGFTGLIEGAP